MPDFSNVISSTMLIPLWAKAVDAQDAEHSILNDMSALDVFLNLGYELDYYDKKAQNASQVGCCLRAKWMDEQTRQFVSEHEAVQVLQLGAGLDNRLARIGFPENITL